MKYYDDVFYNDYPKELWDFKNAKLRPKTLRGIENNNGWVKINSETDLPDNDCNCIIMFNDGGISIDIFKKEGNFLRNHWRHIEYYKVIEIGEPPLY